jgi:sugar lactone lactonase YvrE
MRTVAIILMVAAAPALAGFGSVVSSFRKTDNITSRGLAWVDGNLVTTNASSSGDHRWRVYTPAGSLVATFAGPEEYNAHIGAEHDGTYFWTGSWVDDRVYRFASGGSVVSSFHAGWPNGVAWDGQYIWWTSYIGDWFYKCRPNGSVVTSWRVSSITDTGDLAWDGIYLWCADIGSGYVYRLNTAGAVSRRFAAPGDETYGCAFDGEYLWVSDTTIDHQTVFYKVDIDYSGPAVVPASVGRVRALFR